MDRDLSDKIRERAYEIWVAAGCLDGEAEQHWFAAEQEILAPAKAVKRRVKPRRSKAPAN